MWVMTVLVDLTSLSILPWRLLHKACLGGAKRGWKRAVVWFFRKVGRVGILFYITGAGRLRRCWFPL